MNYGIDTRTGKLVRDVMTAGQALLTDWEVTGERWRSSSSSLRWDFSCKEDNQHKTHNGMHCPATLSLTTKFQLMLTLIKNP